ncbi:MAG TPA: hypothetical protein VFT56_01175 [Sphingomonas sp.]|nr:hypothetical protein [Sphingomonas sp.]
MIPPVALPVVRRAILDLLTEIGGEHNHDTLAMQLVALGHRVAACDVADQLRWLAGVDLVHAEDLGPYVVTRVLSKGRDVAAGMLTVDGVSRHKTGE